jgi:hypothetical protein
MRPWFYRLTMSVLVLAVSRGHAQQCELRVFPGRQFPTPVVEGRAIAADFNADGISDLATLSFQSLLVRRGQLNMGFDLAQVHPVDGARTLSSADLNGDGHVDIAVSVTISGMGRVHIFFNKGDGYFEPGTVVDVRPVLSDLAIADVDNDGDNDIIVTGSSIGDNVVLTNNGKGDFVPTSVIRTGLSSNALSIGDIDNDGDLDVAFVHPGAGRVGLYQNDGYGIYTYLSSIQSGTPRDLALGDVNNDGAIDLVITANSVHVCLGYGNGAFAPAVIYGANMPTRIVLEDFDMDGDLDIGAVVSDCTAGARNHCVLVRYNDGAGVFAISEHPISSVNPRDLAVGDFDGDGRRDLLTTTEYHLYFTINYGGSSGRFASCHRLLSPNWPMDCAIGDLDNDLDLDFAVVNDGLSAVSVINSVGYHAYSPLINYTIGPSSDSVELGDLDNDGDLDIVATFDSGAGDISVLYNAGAGTFSWHAQYSIPGAARAVAIGDVNGDAFPEIAVVSWNTSQLTLWMNDGNGAFTNAVTYSTGNTPIGVRIGDLDADGNNDVVTANGIGTITVFRNLGNGALGPPINFNLGGSGMFPQDIVIGDLNADSLIDVAVTYYSPSAPAYVDVLLNSGMANFPTVARYSTGAGTHSLDIGDINGDGYVDIAAANLVSDNIALLFGRWDGTFESAIYFAAPGGGGSLDIADVDGDLDLDIVSVYSQGVSILFNSGSCRLAGDVNADGFINVTDLLIVIARWGRCPASCPGNINDDAQVNVQDLLLVISNWTQ